MPDREDAGDPGEPGSAVDRKERPRDEEDREQEPVDDRGGRRGDRNQRGDREAEAAEAKRADHQGQDERPVPAGKADAVEGHPHRGRQHGEDRAHHERGADIARHEDPGRQRRSPNPLQHAAVPPEAEADGEVRVAGGDDPERDDTRDVVLVVADAAERAERPP